MEDEVSVGGEELVLEAEAITGGRVGSTMTVNDHGIGAGVRLVPIGIEDPPLDGRSVEARVEESFGPTQGGFLMKAGVDVGEATFVGSVQVGGIDIRRSLE